MKSVLGLLTGEVIALRAESGYRLEHTGVVGVQNVRRTDPVGVDRLVGSKIRRAHRAALPVEYDSLAQDLQLALVHRLELLECGGIVLHLFRG